MALEIYQIYYDDKTKSQLSPYFLPLDNSKNERPDWFEFWPILNFLRTNTLKKDTWYGFLSPKFQEKTGLSFNEIKEISNLIERQTDVIILTHGWDQLSYFLNPFEQGETWHPGLMLEAQKFLDQIGMGINLETLVTDTTTSVFSNFVVAKKVYWEKWKDIAEAFFEYAENNHLKKKLTSYGSEIYLASMKTFIQERLSSLVLSTNDIKVCSPDRSFSLPIYTRIFYDDLENRHLLATCDLMKRYFRSTGDNRYIEMYRMIRKNIPFKKP